MFTRLATLTVSAVCLAASAHGDMAEPVDIHDAIAKAEAGKLWQPSPGDEISFKVLRKGNPFGTHIVRFGETTDGALTATSDVDLKAGFGPITVFRYALDSRETWRDGMLVGLDGDLKVDDREGRVDAQAVGGSLIVDGTEFNGEVPLGILPSSHWNVRQTMAEQLISTEDGEIIDVEMRSMGRETIEAGGTRIEANRFLMDSDIDVDLWYDDEGRWVKLAFEVRDQEIEYVLNTLY